MKKQSELWGGKFYFVYLPTFYDMKVKWKKNMITLKAR